MLLMRSGFVKEIEICETLSMTSECRILYNKRETLERCIVGEKKEPPGVYLGEKNNHIRLLRHRRGLFNKSVQSSNGFMENHTGYPIPLVGFHPSYHNNSNNISHILSYNRKMEY